MTAWQAADDADRDLFAVLGLPWDADGDAVRAAWRITARETHPDHGGDADAFRAAQHARWVLADETRRAAYVLAHEGLARGGSGHAAASDPGASSGRPFADDADFFRGGWGDGDDTEFFDDRARESWGASDGGYDDAAFFDDEDDAAPRGSTDAGPEADDPDPRPSDDDLDDDGGHSDPFGWDGIRSAMSDDFEPPPRARHRCAGCFRHALLGSDRCWSHAGDGELEAAIRLAGPGRCPVLNQRNRPCGAPPAGLTAPFCIHHALGYRMPPGGAASTSREATGSGTSGSPSGPGGGQRGARPRSQPRRQPPTGRPTTTGSRTTPARSPSATSAHAMAGCLTLVAFVAVIGVVLLLAGFIQDAAPGTSAMSALFQAAIGCWVIRRLVGRRSRRRRRR